MLDEKSAKNVEFQGHNEAGRTLAVHSVAVLPAYQGLGVGRTLMKAYVQRMVESDIADRIAILVRKDTDAAKQGKENVKMEGDSTEKGEVSDYTQGFFEKLGFEHKGASGVKRGEGQWLNMVTFDSTH